MWFKESSFLVLGLILAGLAQAASGPELQRLTELTRRANGQGQPLTNDELQEYLALSPVEEVRVSLIMVPAVVLDRRGRPITNLQVKDFEVREQGVPRPVSWFSEEHDRAARLAVLLDTSETMGFEDQLPRQQFILQNLLERVDQAGYWLLLTFADRGVSRHGGWTDRPALLLAPAMALPRQGRTAIRDALTIAAKLLPVTPAERQALILISDGDDNASQKLLEEVVEAARQVALPIYVIACVGENKAIQDKVQGEQSPLAGLHAIAQQTGGRFLFASDEKSAAAAAQVLDRDLRHQYWLAFSPQSPPDGHFRSLQVTVKGREATVLTRAGYK